MEKDGQPMRQSAIVFKSRELNLEGVIASPSGLQGDFPGVVVCHPHPLFGGDMNNAVVTALCQALAEESFVALRFNFRGVGGSEGEFTKGDREHEDVFAALTLLRSWPGVKKGRVGVAGYSFGASMILSNLSSSKGARSLLLISPPLASLDNKDLVGDNRPKQFIVGDRDRLVPYPSLKEKVDVMDGSAHLLGVPAADHSWRGHEAEVARRAVDFFSETLLR